MTDLVIFPGKNTPLKRYIPYFPKFNLRKVVEGERPRVVLVHSLGLIHAINYCFRQKLRTIIICMDGVRLHQKPPDGVRILLFRQSSKVDIGDEMWYAKIIYYAESSHYPYMVKRLRDRIIQYIENI